jgi:hypothetical protein
MPTWNDAGFCYPIRPVLVANFVHVAGKMVRHFLHKIDGFLKKSRACFCGHVNSLFFDRRTVAGFDPAAWPKHITQSASFEDKVELGFNEVFDLSNPRWAVVGIFVEDRCDQFLFVLHGQD